MARQREERSGWRRRAGLALLGVWGSGTIAIAALPAAPVWANCAGGIDPEQVNPQVRQRWQQLQRDETHFWGKTPMFGAIAANRLTLAPAFDQLTGPEKQQVLHTLQLEGSSYEVYTADGRLVSAQYDPCTRSHLLTERDRFRWYLNRPPISAPTAMLGEALRNAGRPQWRTVKHEIAAPTERQIRLQFWQRIGYDQAAQSAWIAWVPEGGYFEITVPNADGVAKVQRFLAVAPTTYHYRVVARDGTPLLNTETTRGNPWGRLLGATSVPSGWQVQPCDRESPFLCVGQGQTNLGSVEMQRWSVDKLPRFQRELTRLGLTPGLITYSNPDHVAKVREALKVLVVDYHLTIERDRQPVYGKTVKYEPMLTDRIQMGSLPGWSYGFQGVATNGPVRERYVSYLAFDGSETVYIVTTCFDPAAATGKFARLSHLEQFQPHLRRIVETLKL